jgi:hypothetical protein
MAAVLIGPTTKTTTMIVKTYIKEGEVTSLRKQKCI